MERKIPFCRVRCNGNELAYLNQVLETGWLTSGPMVQRLEAEFARKVSSRYAFAVNSGTSGLHLSLEALGIGVGDKVIVPTMTFPATAEVVRYLGAEPVFVDVEYGTTLVSPSILRHAVDSYPDVRAFMMVHFAGQALDMLPANGDGIIEICRRRDIKVVEDAAHAFPARADGHMVGSIGDATCFSFYATKPITTGEGGMVTCNDDYIADRIKLMRLHGIDRDAWQRYGSSNSQWEYDVIAPGYKYNMPDLNAALGLAQLERAESMRSDRERCARYYIERLGSLHCVDLPVVRAPMADHAWHLFTITLNESAPIGRNEFINRMTDRGVGTSVHFKPLHRTTYYRDRYGLSPEDFPGAEKTWKGSVSLPIFASMQESELEYVCEAVWDILRGQ